jgi:hypothetical protein
VTLDVRSLWDWCHDLIGRGRLSGGGPLSAPGLDLEDAPPDGDEEAHRAVSGSGMVGPDESDTWHRAPRKD